MKLLKRRDRYRTIQISNGETHDETKVVTANLKPDIVYDPLLYVVFGSICLVFLITSLDTVTSSPVVRDFIISCTNWGTLYVPWFPERLWAPVTCQWFHGSWDHLFGNMVGFAIVAAWLCASFDVKTWRIFFFVFGPIAGIVFVHIYHCPPADFSHWHGPLNAITAQSAAPLAGASGGVFAMLGGTLAAAVRYHQARIRGWMPVGVVELAALPAMQFLFVDWNNNGIAGLAHIVAFVLGLAYGFIPRVRGGVSLLTSNNAAIQLDSVTVDDRFKTVTAAVLLITSGFDESKDFVLQRQDMLGFHAKPIYKMIAGTPPTIGTRCAKLDLRIAETNVPRDVQRWAARRIWKLGLLVNFVVSLLAQAMFSEYSTSGFPSIFFCSMMYGLLVLFKSVQSAGTRLEYKPGVDTQTISVEAGLPQTNVPEVDEIIVADVQPQTAKV